MITTDIIKHLAVRFSAWKLVQVLYSKLQLGVKQSLDGDPIAVKDIDLDSESSALLNQELYLMDGQNYVEIIA